MVNNLSERNGATRQNTARNLSATVLRSGIPPETRAQQCRAEYPPTTRVQQCRVAEYRPQPKCNGAAQKTRLQPERNGAARWNTARTQAQRCCAVEYRPQSERNGAARNTATQASSFFPAVIFKFSNCRLDICTLNALHTGFKNHPARAQSTQKCPQKCAFRGPLVPGVRHSKWDDGTSHEFFRSACGGWSVPSQKTHRTSHTKNTKHGTSHGGWSRHVKKTPLSPVKWYPKTALTGGLGL
jgi:hypothetical protein